MRATHAEGSTCLIMLVSVSLCDTAAMQQDLKTESGSAGLQFTLGNRQILSVLPCAPHCRGSMWTPVMVEAKRSACPPASKAIPKGPVAVRASLQQAPEAKGAFTSCEAGRNFFKPRLRACTFLTIVHPTWSCKQPWRSLPTVLFSLLLKRLISSCETPHVAELFRGEARAALSCKSLSRCFSSSCI